MTAMRQRGWRGVKPVAGLSGIAITTRLRTAPADDAVLHAVAGHLGHLRRADLVRICRPASAAGTGGGGRRQTHRAGQNARKRNLTALSSAELHQVTADRGAGRVRVTDGGKRLARTRHSLQAAELTLAGWQEAWQTARWRIEAIGSGDEPFGNLTITVTPGGEVSIRLPRPLEHLANAPRGRYVLSGRAKFSYRGDEWLVRITGHRPVSYTVTRRPGRAGVYLTAAWATTTSTPGTDPETLGSEVHVAGPVVGVDLNEGHLAVRRLDPHGNPVGRPERIEFSLDGSAAHRDAQVRHAITRLIRYTRRHSISVIAVEDLNFADARTTGRETMGRGRRGRRFRKTVAGIPTAVFRNRLTAQACRGDIQLYAVNPAYTSAWGTSTGATLMRTSPGTRRQPP